MVDENTKISNENLNKYIILYFEQHLKKFLLISSYDTGRYFGIKFSNGIIDIFVQKEIGFWIEITINNAEYQLWEYDRTVNNFTENTKKNVLYQLDVLKRFLEDYGVLA